MKCERLTSEKVSMAHPNNMSRTNGRNGVTAGQPTSPTLYALYAQGQEETRHDAVVKATSLTSRAGHNREALDCTIARMCITHAWSGN